MKFKVLLGLAAAALGLLVTSAPALAYNVGPGTTATTSVSSVAGGTAFTATFTFIDTTGAPIAGVVVNFSATGPCAGTTFSPASATTNASGVVTTTVTLPANCPGAFTLTGTLTSGQGSASVTVTETGGFPITSAVPQAVPIWAILALLAGALLVIGGGFGFVRSRTAPSRA